MLAGEQDPARLAEMSKGLLRNKIPQLQLALEGTEHHRSLLRQLLDHLRFTELKLSEIEQGSTGERALLRIRSLGCAPSLESTK